MVEIRFGHQVLEAPKLVRIEGVTPSLYDALMELEEDVKAELIDGVMIVHSPEKIPHEGVFGFLFTLMNLFAYATHAGRVFGSMATVHLAECRKVKPDIAFVSHERSFTITRDAIEGAPDIVVEVISESTRRYDFGEKRKVYEQAGVPEIWLLDFERQQFIVRHKVGRTYHSETKKQGVIRSKVLEGFWLRAEWLWQEPPTNPMECLRQILSSPKGREQRRRS